MNKMIHSLRFITLMVLLLCIGGVRNAFAQCEASPDRLPLGQELQYDLYFKYGLLNAKAGYGSLRVSSPTQAGQKQYKLELISHSTGMARKFFALDDTLSCTLDERLRPVRYEKFAHEGNEHTTDLQTYQYLPGGKISIWTRRVRNGVERHNTTLTVSSCTYDMMSVISYAQTLDYSSMKVGSKRSVVFISGQKEVPMDIMYRGTTKIKANDGKEYNCHKLQLYIADPAFDNPREAMTVYLTTDQQCFPIRLDTKLKIGYARAVYKGKK